MDVTGGASTCSNCGTAVGVPQDLNSRGFGVAAAAARERIRYAGFWLRAAAYVIDSVLIGFAVLFAIVLPMMQHAGIAVSDARVLWTGATRQIFAINLAAAIAQWLYWSLMESSPWQATFGKKLLGLQVTDLEGRRISFGRATGRYFAKALSTLILLLGYVMAGFTEKKQALHDLLAGCLVIKKTNASQS